MNRKLTQAFTLIELLVVLVIIMFMAGLVVGVGRSARQSAKKSKAKVMIASTEVSISIYKADVGTYPLTGTGAAPNPGSQTLYDYLTNTAAYGPGGSGELAGWNGPYMEFNVEDLTSAPVQIKDPWNHAYNYRMPGVTYNTSSFQLWSNGPDGTSGTTDDITNW